MHKTATRHDPNHLAHRKISKPTSTSKYFNKFDKNCKDKTRPNSSNGQSLFFDVFDRALTFVIHIITIWGNIGNIKWCGAIDEPIVFIVMIVGDTRRCKCHMKNHPSTSWRIWWHVRRCVLTYGLVLRFWTLFTFGTFVIFTTTIVALENFRLRFRRKFDNSWQLKLHQMYFDLQSYPIIFV